MRWTGKRDGDLVGLVDSRIHIRYRVDLEAISIYTSIQFESIADMSWMTQVED